LPQDPVLPPFHPPELSTRFCKTPEVPARLVFFLTASIYSLHLGVFRIASAILRASARRFAASFALNDSGLPSLLMGPVHFSSRDPCPRTKSQVPGPDHRCLPSLFSLSSFAPELLCSHAFLLIAGEEIVMITTLTLGGGHLISNQLFTTIPFNCPGR